VNGKCKVEVSVRFGAVVRHSAVAHVLLMTKINSRMVFNVAISEPPIVQIKEKGGR
jgi:hypothetical protein